MLDTEINPKDIVHVTLDYTCSEATKALCDNRTAVVLDVDTNEPYPVWVEILPVVRRGRWINPRVACNFSEVRKVR